MGDLRFQKGAGYRRRGPGWKRPEMRSGTNGMNSTNENYAGGMSGGRLRLPFCGVGAYCSLMRVLIIGCGYVGLPLGAELVKQGHEVFGLRRSPGTEAEFKSAGIKPLTADISKAEQLAQSPAGASSSGKRAGGRGAFRSGVATGLV
jgi:hypothetical protein